MRTKILWVSINKDGVVVWAVIVDCNFTGHTFKTLLSSPFPYIGRGLLMKWEVIEIGEA